MSVRATCKSRAVAKTSAVFVVAAALLLSGSAVATRADTSRDVSIKRGDGNEVIVTVTNKGPSPTVVQGARAGSRWPWTAPAGAPSSWWSTPRRLR
jgi:hypothetical protein